VSMDMICIDVSGIKPELKFGIKVSKEEAESFILQKLRNKLGNFIPLPNRGLSSPFPEQLGIQYRILWTASIGVS
ncbi:MAG: hypothetical protein UU67_C0005G0020, partial [Candidatus Daviesbacteria bacterium GW2011_GWB1_41_5]